VDGITTEGGTPAMEKLPKEYLVNGNLGGCIMNNENHDTLHEDAKNRL
jgi:hypothetical protein